jgi:hypothetical protein
MKWAEDYIHLSFSVCHKVNRSLKLLNAFNKFVIVPLKVGWVVPLLN